MNFFVLKKRFVFAVVGVLALIFFLFSFISKPSSTQPTNIATIVIDAGHGGIDGGCTGVSSGVKESDLNLKYSKILEKMCQEVGFKVIMTRSSEEGLYSPLAKNKKRSEMEKREEIIKNSDADLFVSVHMNSMTNHSLSGAQVFYKQGSQSGKIFADCVTNFLKADLGKTRGESKGGDYYVLNCHDKAGILIECGFLSNEEEEKLLMDHEYMETFCNSVLKGIISFLKM